MSGGNKTTTTTSAQPYPAFKPGMDQAGKDALSLYRKGGLAPVYSGSTVVPYSKQTLAGHRGAVGMADSLRPGMQAGYKNIQGLLGAGGFNNPMQEGISGMRGAVGGSQDLSNRAQTDLASAAVNNPSMSGFSQLAGQTDPSYSEQNLSSIAKGGMLGGGDPYFEDVLKRASEEARFAADRTAGGMGRYGSDDHYGAMAKDITDLQLRARSDQYNRERAAQMAANAQLDQFRLADDASRLSALSGLGGTYATGQGQALNAANAASQIASGNRDARMGALSQMFDMGQAGINNRLNATNALGGAYDNIMGTYQPTFAYGSAMEDLYGRQLNDKIRIQQGKQNQSVDNLRNLMGLLGGGQFSTQTQTAQGPSNTASNIAGLGLGGLSMLGGGMGWW